MKKRIFPVKRDEIYAGQVITDFELDSDNREFKSFYVFWFSVKKKNLSF